MRGACLAISVLALAACNAGAGPVADAGTSSESLGDMAATTVPMGEAALAQIDPLGGTWIVRSVGMRDFPGDWGRVNFSGGGFFTHEAGCGGGHPAFYQARADGTLEVRRREAVRIGKCEGDWAPDFERRLAAFFDKAATWSRDGDVLRLTDSDGQVAVLERPADPVPALAGRWQIVTIGGQVWTGSVTPTVQFQPGWMSGSAGCNTGGAQWSAPAPGRIAVGSFAATQMGCSQELLESDSRLFGALAGVTGYEAGAEGRMVLTGRQEIVLERPPAPSARLKGRYRGCGNTIIGLYGGELTMDFASDTATDQAGCRASYSVDGTALSLDFDDSPACSTPRIDRWDEGRDYAGREVSTLALLRPDALAFDETGQLVMRAADGRTLTLCRAD
ncbi:META domain-containing protein [Paraurantiacibacter namhicola]|uniref:META domain protein n=1 Tax=Paraurantiacibacter namhicola TaxID=645517 RepID=A0A1C7D672_9SPHN|nr:META domain-containing protein [Paraurantiacibacter namhicola]ANU06852.1 META domain protein [Paraurantiacibacter namhicola]